MSERTQQRKWDERFYALATLVSTWSKDPDCVVGAVLVSPDRRRLAVGYNGFVTGASDDYEGTLYITKLRRTVHAELNAVLNARADLTGWTMYSTKYPCSDCAKAIIQSGVVRVCCPRRDSDSQWMDSQLHAASMLLEARVEVTTR